MKLSCFVCVCVCVCVCMCVCVCVCVRARACAFPSFFWWPLPRCVLLCVEGKMAVSAVRLLAVMSVDLVCSLHYPLLQTQRVELDLCGGYFFFFSNISYRTYSHPSSSSTLTVSHFDSSLSLVKTTSGTWLSFSNLTFLFTGHMTCFCLGLWSACWEWKIFLLSAILHLSTSHIREMRKVMLAAVSRVLFLKWKPRQIKFVWYCLLSKFLFW